MKHHGNYETQSVFDIGVGITNHEAAYVGDAITQLRNKCRNTKRKREKDRKRKWDRHKRRL